MPEPSENEDFSISNPPAPQPSLCYEVCNFSANENLQDQGKAYYNPCDENHTDISQADEVINQKLFGDRFVIVLHVPEEKKIVAEFPIKPKRIFCRKTEGKHSKIVSGDQEPVETENFCWKTAGDPYDHRQTGEEYVATQESDTPVEIHSPQSKEERVPDMNLSLRLSGEDLKKENFSFEEAEHYVEKCPKFENVKPTNSAFQYDNQAEKPLVGSSENVSNDPVSDTVRSGEIQVRRYKLGHKVENTQVSVESYQTKDIRAKNKGSRTNWEHKNNSSVTIQLFESTSESMSSCKGVMKLNSCDETRKQGSEPSMGNTWKPSLHENKNNDDQVEVSSRKQQKSTLYRGSGLRSKTSRKLKTSTRHKKKLPSLAGDTRLSTRTRKGHFFMPKTIATAVHGWFFLCVVLSLCSTSDATSLNSQGVIETFSTDNDSHFIIKIDVTRAMQYMWSYWTSPEENENVLNTILQSASILLLAACYTLLTNMRSMCYDVHVEMGNRKLQFLMDVNLPVRVVFRRCQATLMDGLTENEEPPEGFLRTTALPFLSPKWKLTYVQKQERNRDTSEKTLKLFFVLVQ